jgi:hypothetical protein
MSNKVLIAKVQSFFEQALYLVHEKKSYDVCYKTEVGNVYYEKSELKCDYA